MKYFLQFVALFSLAVNFTSCYYNNSQGPDTTPYLYIHSGQFYDSELEKWIIVTNGSGELVGYKKIDPTHDESTLIQRNASIKDKINIYEININQLNTQITAVLGVEPGQQCYLGSKVSSTNTLHANLYKIPNKSSVTSGNGGFGMELWDLNTSDGIIDSVQIIFGAEESIPVYPLTVYTRTSPKYVNVNTSTREVSKFNYPDDFLNFDHVIDVPTVKTPTTVTTSGTKGGTRISFLSLYTPGVMSDVETNQSVKLCYNDGYDSYSTSYRFDNSGYYRDGSIPSSASSFIIPNRSMVVTNHELYSFAATIPAEIDYRISAYTYEETVGGIIKKYVMRVISDVTRNDSFDLTLPDEFVTAHGSWDFSKYTYYSTIFYEFENDEKYTKVVDDWLAVPGSNPIGQYYYIVN